MGVSKSPIFDVQDALGRLSYSEIARRAGMTKSGVSRIFRGRRRAKTETLAKLAQALNVTMDELHAYLSKLPKNGERYGWGNSK